MTYDRVKQPKLSDNIVRQLEEQILAGILIPGERLPPERDLAAQLDVSRPSLREALQKLETKGLLETRQGGGTYVADFVASTFTDPLTEILRSNPAAAADFVELRRVLEGSAAYWAALRATDEDRELLTACFEAMEAAHQRGDKEVEAEIDTDFHIAIAEAAHNLVLLHIMHGLVRVLREGVFYNRLQLYNRQGARDILLRQHRAVYDAIIAGDPEAARQAARDHMSYVQDVMRELQREETRKTVSRRRLERYLAQREERLSGVARRRAPRRKPLEANESQADSGDLENS